MWSHICKPLLPFNKFHSLVHSNIGYSFGYGSRIRFWLDDWIEGTTLTNQFPRIFAFAINKTGCIKEFGHWSNNIWLWNIHLCRRLFDWETQQWDSFWF